MKPDQQQPSLPSVDSWTHRPIFLKTAPGMEDSLSATTNSPGGGYPIGVPFEFESEFFKGKTMFRLRGLEASKDPQGNFDYFKGRKRFFQMVVQGRFKKEMNVSDIMFGMEYSKPLLKKPPKLMMRPIQALLKRTCPGIELDLISQTPKVLSTFAGGVQTIRMDAPGLEPDITSSDIKEETLGFGGFFADEQKSSAKRKKIFSNPKLTADYVFDTESVYTFDHYDDVIDVANFQLKLSSLFHCPFEKIVDEPFQQFAKTKSGACLWSFELWHERLVSTLPCQ